MWTSVKLVFRLQASSRADFTKVASRHHREQPYCYTELLFSETVLAACG
jgi:hypothetical protein